LKSKILGGLILGALTISIVFGSNGSVYGENVYAGELVNESIESSEIGEVITEGTGESDEEPVVGENSDAEPVEGQSDNLEQTVDDDNYEGDSIEEVDTQGVPSDAANFNGNSYKIYYTRLNWEVAKERCESLGGHLATITSAEEQAFIESLNKSGTRLWIGGYREAINDWKWITGEPWSYTHWGSGEPNNSTNVLNNENRVSVWPYFWNDLNEKSSEQSGYICEWEGVDLTSQKLYPAKINYKGYVVAPLVFLNTSGKAIKNTYIHYKCSDGKEATAITDDEGIAYLCSNVMTYNKSDTSKNKGTLKFTVTGNGTDIPSFENSVEYEITPLTYTEKYSGTVSLSGKLGIGVGVGASVGPAEAKASLADASIKGQVDSTYEYVHTRKDDGQHCITLEQAYNLSAAVSAEAGPKAEAVAIGDLQAKVKALSASAKGKIAGERAVGIEIDNISDSGNINDFVNSIPKERKLKIGYFFLANYANTLPAGRIIIQALDYAGCSYYDYKTTKITASGEVGVEALSVEAGGFSASAAAAKAGITAKLSFTSKANGEQINSVDLVTNAEAGVGNVSYKYGSTKADFGSLLKVSKSEDYKLKTKRVNGTLSEVSVGQVVGKEKATFFNSYSRTLNTTFKGNNAVLVAGSAPIVNTFSIIGDNTSSGNLLPSAADILEPVRNLQSSVEAECSVEESYAENIPDIEIGLGAQLFAEVKGAVGLKGYREKSYDVVSGTYNYNKLLRKRAYLPTGVSEVSSDSIDFNLDAFIKNAINDAKTALSPYISVAESPVVQTVTSGVIKMTPLGGMIDAAKNIYSGYKWIVTQINPNDKNASAPSYDVCTYRDPVGETEGDDLLGAGEEDKIQKTVGSFVEIALVNPETNETVESFPEVELTINYTDADLTEAGATSSQASSLAIYKYNEDTGRYLYVGGDVNTVGKYVTARITQSGMYILAIDGVAPTVEGVYVTDNTSTPTIIAKVNEISDFSVYSLKLDDVEIVNAENYKQYSNPVTGYVEYPVTTPLSLGTHVVKLSCVDASGNSASETYVYEFTVEREKVAVESISLSLEDDIAVNIYTNLSKDVVENGFAMINDVRYVIPKASADGTYLFRARKSAKQMDETITFAIYDGNHELVPLENEKTVDGKFTYCIRDYINAVKDGGDELADLVKALDTYGLCAKDYFGYNTPAANSIPEVAVAQIGEGFELSQTGSLPDGIEYLGSSLILKDRITVRHYFSSGLRSYVVTVDGVKKSIDYKEGVCYVDVTGISPVNYGQKHVLKVGDYELGYCPYTYIDAVHRKSSDPKLNKLVNSLYWYGFYAEKYWGRS